MEATKYKDKHIWESWSPQDIKLLKKPTNNPLPFDPYSITSTFLGCMIFHKQDFLQYISPSKFRSHCTCQRMIFST